MVLAISLLLSGCLKAPRSTDSNPDTCLRTPEGEKRIYFGVEWLTYCEGHRGFVVGMDAQTPGGDRIAASTEQEWPKLFPAWAHGRRAEILNTIRKLAAEKGRRVLFYEE